MFKLANGSIVNVANFLSQLKLKSRASRARTVLISRLAAKEDENKKVITDIQQRHVKMRDGEPEADENGAMVFHSDESKQAYIDEMNEFYNEKTTVDVADITSNLEALYHALDEYDEVLSGQDAAIYDIVCSQLENISNLKGE